MSTPIHAGSNSRHVNVRVKVPQGLTPLDLPALEAELDTAVEITRRNLRAAKLAHDVQLLRAALLADTDESYTLATAQADIEDSPAARLTSSRLLTSALRMAGWRQETPDPNPRRVYKEKRGILGGSYPEETAREHSEDVLVNLHNGMTIVAAADSAYDWHWEYPWKAPPGPDGTSWGFEHVDPVAIGLGGNWWNTGKYTAGLDLGGSYWSASSDITKRGEARRALTVPALPVDLDALLRELSARR